MRLRSLVKTLNFESDEIKLSEQINVIEKQLTSYIKYFLEDTFGVTTSELISYDKNNAEIRFENNAEMLTFTLSPNGIFTQVKLNKDVRIKRVEGQEAKITITDELMEVNKNLSQLEVTQLAISEIIRRLLGNLSSTAIIPIERSMIMSNLHGYIISYFIISEIENLIMKLFLEKLSYSLAKLSLESRVREHPINAKITYKIFLNPASFPELQIEENGKRLSPRVLSSGYVQLLPIDIISEYYENLIIEELELNLHADAQVKIGDHLFKLAKEKGKKLLITTHSEILAVQSAYNSVRKGENKITFKPYLLNEGRVEELKVTEKGDIEEIATITDVLREQFWNIYGIERICLY